MKIVHVINSLENGGAEAVLYRLVTHPSEDTHHVISLASPSWYSSALAENGIDVHHLGLNSPLEFGSCFLALINLLRKLKPDIVQTWMYRANLVGGLAAKIVGAPTVWGIHCSTFDSRFPFKSRMLVYLSGATAGWLPKRIINCSDRSAIAHQKIGFPRSRTAVVPNGFDTGAFWPNSVARRRVRSEFAIGDDEFLIGTVARWHPQKDHPNLLKALEFLRCEVDASWKCVLVGPGMDASNDALARLLTAAGIAGQVILAGPRLDIADVMPALDLHILPSAFGEAFPNVVAEFMACGTPCIVTDVGDAAFMVADTGWIVPPSAPDRLAELIAAAMKEARSSDNGSWKYRKHQGRQRIIENFAIDVMYRKYRSVWSSIVAVAPQIFA